jgi:dsRNA-specific ribonuclease
MAITPEGKVKKRVRQILDAHNAYYFMPVQTGYGSAGLDFHGCHQGKAFFIETKAPGGKPTARQKLLIRDLIESYGAAVFLVDGSAASLKLLEDWLDINSRK